MEIKRKAISVENRAESPLMIKLRKLFEDQIDPNTDIDPEERVLNRKTLF